MKWKKSIKKSKIKTLTNNGEKAITRGHYFKEKGKKYIGIYFEVLCFSKEKEVNTIRKIGNKYVNYNSFAMKLTTLERTLKNLGL